MFPFGDLWPRRVPSHSFEAPPNSQSKGSFKPKALDLNLPHCLPLFSGLVLPKGMGKVVFISGKTCGLVLKESFAILSKITKGPIRVSEENNVTFPVFFRQC